MIRGTLTVFAWLVFATALQGVFGTRMSIGFASPDFILLTAIFISLPKSQEQTLIIGGISGLFHSAMLNEKLAAFVISRMGACFASKRLNEAILGGGIFTLIFVVFAGTLVSGLLYLFIGVPRDILSHLADTIGSALYNGVLASLVHAISRKRTTAQV
jgi:hypothetical protein